MSHRQLWIGLTIFALFSFLNAIQIEDQTDLSVTLTGGPEKLTVVPGTNFILNCTIDLPANSKEERFTQIDWRYNVTFYKNSNLFGYFDRKYQFLDH